jgi:ATP-binding cassette subfamily C protein
MPKAQGSEQNLIAAACKPTIQDLLLVACEKIACNLAVEIKRPMIDITQMNLAEQLHIITAASQLRVRKIDLRDSWWLSDHGLALLVLRKQDQKPFALLATHTGKYQIFDPENKKLFPLTPKIAETLENYAYCFYRNFPKTTLTPLRLLSFSLFGLNKELLRALVFQTCTTLLGLLIPILIGAIFNYVVPNSDFNMLWQFIIILTISTFVIANCRISQIIALTRLTLKANVTMQSAIWDHLLKLPAWFFKKFEVGDLAIRVGAIDDIRQILTGDVLLVFLSGLFSIITLLLMFIYDYKLALGALFLALILASVNIVASLIRIKYQRRLLEQRGKVANFQIQFLTGIRKLRVANRENKCFQLWSGLFDKQVKLFTRAGLIGIRFGVFQTVYAIIITILLFIMVIMRGVSLSFGTFIAFSAAFAQFFIALNGLAGVVADMLQIIVLHERARPIIDAHSEEAKLITDFDKLHGKVELSQVEFHYPDSEAKLFKNLSIKAPPQKFTAIVGSSGAGKSTIVRLLLGFDYPQAGVTLYDDHDIKSLNIHIVRQQLGVVMQDSAILPGTIYDNIAGVKPISRDEAMEALRQAALADEVNAMPLGLDTTVSEFGRTLSVGQKQRLLIARALAIKPQVLILDEATSSLDNKTQQEVMANIIKLPCTKIVIAHRFSTVINADLIYVIENGRISQSGTYQELAAKPGPFKDFMQRQQV